MQYSYREEIIPKESGTQKIPIICIERKQIAYKRGTKKG